jgi:Uri superfamily endonuclease
MDAGGHAIPEGPGVYVLLLVARATESIRVGKLGVIHVVAGRPYAYVGSALNGLARRIGRHLATSGKKLHWHVDYLLEHLDIRAIFLALTTTRKECEISRIFNELPDHFQPIEGFGNSDCKACPSHLYEGIAGDDQDSIDAITRAAFRGSGLQPLVVDLVNK